MLNLILDNAAWITITCAALMTLTVIAFSVRAWHQWRRLKIVREAASALVAVHSERVDEAILIASRKSGAITDRSEGLADLLVELKRDIDHLRWLLDRVPSDRAALERAIADILLPTARNKATEATDK